MKLISENYTIEDVQVGKIGSYIFPTNSYAFYISLFFLSMIGLSFGYVMALTTFSYTFAFQGIELLSYIVLVFSFTGLVSASSDISYFRIVGLIFLLWQLVILIRGDYSDMNYFLFKQLLFDLNYGGIIYMIPFLIFFKFNLYLIKKLFDAIAILGVIFVISSLFNFAVLSSGDVRDPVSVMTAEMYFKYFAICIGILALNFNLISNKYKFLVVFLLLAIVVMAIFRARRGMLFMTSLISFFAILNYFINSKKKFHIIFYITYCLIGIFLILFYTLDLNFKNVAFFNNITERGLEDTRSYVENCFYADMTTDDWIFGKGYNGGYECSGIDDEIFKGGVRRVIETDYLQLILSGGIINLLLLFCIMIPAIVLGLFYSNNNLIKTFAIWIFCWMLFLYPSNMYSINIYHVSIWFSAGLCYSRPLRLLHNSFINDYFVTEFTLKSNNKEEENV
ncbi:hypothetical protein [Algoriphagus antarcticus]|uniref:O-antigen ligase-like membrane protein n=1 Tax=Algoriphagus antarcticus TaxID=238540 RepID=A0A3E0DHG3_9BACT|nr:hypothetical protein [Algoriphagus antarcticus]REG81414.1 hypothetical protein C8N25_12762 [Algoriphagus antarcticus]